MTKPVNFTSQLKWKMEMGISAPLNRLMMVRNLFHYLKKELIGGGHFISEELWNNSK
jgi:hypothetical protein